jgi:hypothetical protein
MCRRPARPELTLRPRRSRWRLAGRASEKTQTAEVEQDRLPSRSRNRTAGGWGSSPRGRAGLS